MSLAWLLPGCAIKSKAGILTRVSYYNDCLFFLTLPPPPQAGMFRPLKAFLIELALGWVGHKTSMALDPKFKLPKMKYKGEEVRS